MSPTLPEFPDVPLIPPEVYASRDRGDLVLFCGAGVSKGAGCPRFDELAAAVERKFDKVDLKEAQAFGAKQVDRYLQFVEQRVDLSSADDDRPAPTQLREFVRSRLNVHTPNVPLHEALLKLARDRDGRTRLVTTNYDPHFRTAAENLELAEVQHQAAPRIGPPDRELWSGVVYLHGEFRGSHLRDLVLTSGDFGRAYITERWAARFITELFKNFDVLFLGYSANDPVVRYVLDAFAARRGKSRRTIWAMASPGADSEEAFRAHWESINVRLIPYSDANGHQGVSIGLMDWASVIEEPSSRAARVRNILERGPRVGEGLERNSSKVDEAQLTWLLGSGSIDVGQVLLRVQGSDAEPRPTCSSDWLPVFARLGLLGIEAVQFAPQRSERTKHGPQLVGIPAAEARLSTALPMRLGAIARGFATWLAALAADGSKRADGTSNSEELLKWIQQSGRQAALHPELADMVRRRMSSAAAGLPSELREAWRLVLDPSVNARLSPPLSEEVRWALQDELSSGGISELTAHQMLDALTPVAIFDRGSTAVHARAFFRTLRDRLVTESPAEDEEEWEPRRHDYARSSIVLRCGDNEALRLLKKLDSSHKRGWLLRCLALGANHNLERALELLAQTQPVFGDIEGHQYERVGALSDQSRKYAWTLLADLTWYAGAELDRIGDRRALSLYEAWLAGRHVTQHRLALHAAAHWIHLSADKRQEALHGDFA